MYLIEGICEDMFDFINANKLFYICRMRENAAVWRFSAMIADLLIDSTKDDFTTQMKNGAGIRIVKYAINNKNYYMATTNAQSAYVIFIFIKTNLLDAQHFPISFIKENYGHRWTVEEYFKYVKQTLSLNKLQESKELMSKNAISPSFCLRRSRMMATWLNCCWTFTHTVFLHPSIKRQLYHIITDMWMCLTPLTNIITKFYKLRIMEYSKIVFVFLRSRVFVFVSSK